MLSIRNAEPTDFDALKAFMIKEKQWNEAAPTDFLLLETMLLVDDDTILGYVSAALIENQPFISAIYIPEKLRNHLFGDATLRGLLFYFMNKGFKQVYAHQNTAISDFLLHEGFIAQENVLELTLEDFFNQKCRGCRDAH
jgi:hypothetical protein